MADAEGVPDPFNEMAQGAIALHSLFTEYVNAGFTPEQALQLCIAILSANIMKGNTS